MTNPTFSWFRALAYCLCFLATGMQKTHADTARVAQGILGSLSNNCPSVGSFTRASVAQAQDLIEILRSLRDDPECRSLSGAISSLQILNQRAAQITQDPELRNQLAEEKAKQEILFQLSVVSDPTERSRLQSALIDTEIELSRINGIRDADSRFAKQTNRKEAAQSLVASTQSLLQQALANQNCLVKHPSLLTGLAQISGAVASAFAGPGAALAMAASVDLVGSLVEFFRVSRLNRQIDQFSQGLLANAMQCGLEALSHQYCAAQDAHGILRLKSAALTRDEKERQPRPPTEEGILLGLYLLDVDAPRFLDWLRRVESGQDATNSAAADRQSDVFSREASVKIGLQQGLGVITERSEDYAALMKNRANEPPRLDDSRWTYLRTTLQQVLVRTNNNGPMGEIYSNGYAPYFLLGIADGPGIRDPNSNYIPITAFNPASLPAFRLPESLEPIAQRLREWNARASRLVELERSRVLITDPLALVVDASQEDILEQSPLKSLAAIEAFLIANRPTVALERNQPLRKLYGESLDRLAQIRKEIECVVDETLSCDEPSQNMNFSLEAKASRALVRIQALAKLSNGVALFADRIRWAVRLSLNELLRDETTRSLQASAQLLAADDVLAEIMGSSRGVDSTLLERDLVKAQSTTQMVMMNFVSVFEDSLNRVLKQYGDQARIAREGIAGVNLSSRAELCLKLASAPEWPSGVSKKLCLGTQLKSVFERGPLAPVVSEELINRPYAERACLFRDYSRQNRIYERFVDKRFNSKRPERP